MRLALVLAVALLTGCTSTSDDSGAAPSTPAALSESPSTMVEIVPPDPGPTPKVGECHALGFGQAIAVDGRTAPVSCRRTHTAQTYFVGRLRLETPAGNTRLVDSIAAQRQARTTCAARLPRHLGVEPRELRLRMAQAVWFTPSAKRAEAGADWFRCDLVVVAAPGKLQELPRRTKGSGDAPALAMCATAEPGTRAFRRVTCGAEHSWVAVSTVDLSGEKLPAPGVIAGRMDPVCRDAARSRASDPLSFTWSQESPTKEQWDAGQRYGICWAPA